MNLFLIKRSIKHWFQRRIRGFDDSETWSLDLRIAKFVLPRLKRFKEISITNPMDLTEEEWDNILDEIIYAMEICSNDDNFLKGEDEIDWNRVHNGLELFGERFRDLWW